MKISEKTKTWIKKAGIRAIKTTAQTFAAMATVTSSFVDLKAIALTSLMAGFLSLVTSIAGLPEIKDSEQTNE